MACAEGAHADQCCHFARQNGTECTTRILSPGKHPRQGKMIRLPLLHLPSTRHCWTRLSVTMMSTLTPSASGRLHVITHKSRGPDTAFISHYISLPSFQISSYLSEPQFFAQRLLSVQPHSSIETPNIINSTFINPRWTTNFLLTTLWSAQLCWLM